MPEPSVTEIENSSVTFLVDETPKSPTIQPVNSKDDPIVSSTIGIDAKPQACSNAALFESLIFTFNPVIPGVITEK